MEDYFKLGKHKARPLNNPLAAEFGIYTQKDLDEFLLNHLPGFALVRVLCFAFVRQAVSAVSRASNRLLCMAGLRHPQLARFRGWSACVPSASFCFSFDHERLAFRVSPCRLGLHHVR